MINMLRNVASLTGIFAVFVLFLALTYAYTSPSFVAYKPLEISIVYQMPTVTVTALQLGYNSTTDRYENVTVTVLNAGTSSASLTVFINFYSLTQLIASGTNSLYGLPPNQQASLTIALNWLETYTLANVTNGEIVIHQQPGGS